MISRSVTYNHPGREHIAYFSMEIGINHKMPTYSGGLGVLAGDTLKSFSDLGLPVVAISLLNEKGYFYQRIDNDGNQIEEPMNWRMHDFLVLMPNEVNVKVEGRDVKVRAWKYMHRGLTGHTLPIFFLDTNIEGNSDYDRSLTSFLYGGDRKYRLSQEIILGIAGLRMLESLGYHNIKKYHMNEGHAALLTVELLRRTYNDNPIVEQRYDLNSVKDKCVFTTHTPVAAGHDMFDMGLFKQLMGDFVPDFILDKSIEQDKMSMTLLALNMSKYVNGVAKRHGEISREMFPNFQIYSITNGIHTHTWASHAFKKLFDKYIPGWAVDPYTLRNALSIPKDEVWESHMEAKRALIDEVNIRTNIGFDAYKFTIGYARRFTSYKRPDLLLHDIERLKRIGEEVGDIQIIYAGKAHPSDFQGKEILKRIINTAKDINSQNCRIKIVFLRDYDMWLAKHLVSGCDVWLNTPQRPYEASGTSGMKAALNGVPHISTLDGWWLEGHIDNLTGWCLGPHPQDPNFNNDSSPDDEAEDLYTKLKDKIIPTFYGNRQKWVDIMRHCIAFNASFFNTYRMAQQYIAGAYVD